MDDEIYEAIGVEDLEPDVQQTETVQYVTVEDIANVVVETDEAFSSFGSTNEILTHNDLKDRDISDQHPIEAISGLEGVLKILSSPKDVYTEHGGFAEFQEWKSDGYYKTDESYMHTGGVGFFVSLVTETGSTSGGNIRVDICKKINNDNTVEVTDVYGVTVAQSGFYGNQAADYDVLDSTAINKANNPNYAKVCLLGSVKVRVSAEEHLKINAGDYVVPNEFGYAKKSDNHIGFKVISKGQIEAVGDDTTAWYYAEIALVPQNDNISRVMAELEKAKVHLENVDIKLDDMSDIYDINIGISNKFDTIQGVVNAGKIEIEQQLQEAKKVATKAQNISKAANKTINDVALEYAEAVTKANEAKDLVGDALITVNKIKQDLQPLAQWQEDGSNNVAGFVAQANANATTLATITEAYGTDLTGIIQKIDENGAVIQHLVTHIDKYTLGSISPTYGLSLSEEIFMRPGVIYVPTVDHIERYTYKDGEEDKEVSMQFTLQATDNEGNLLGYGQSYIWKVTENKPYDYMWAPDKIVYLSLPLNPSKDDLWYCWEGVIVDNKYQYEPGVLYCYDNAGDGSWVAVASVSDKSARAIGLVNQTAEKLTIAYTNIEGDIGSLQVEVDRIGTLVENTETGALSAINQTAENIRLGVHKPVVGSTQLELLLGGMDSTTTYLGHVLSKTVLAAPPANIDKYSHPPIWDGDEFVFLDGGVSVNGEYYFDSYDHTEYCKIINNGAAYEVYTIGNPSMANLHTRVTNTESEVGSWTRFQKGQNETITSIEQLSDEKGASISSMVYGDFRECVEIKLELTDEDKMDFSTDKYSQLPAWNKDGKQFSFEGLTQTTNGTYCLSATDNVFYYKLFYRNNEVISYEKYTMKSSPYATLVQKVDDNGSYVGLVSGNDDKMGSVFVNTINDKSEVLIDADKIGINGTAVFTDNWDNTTTSISGGFMKSVVLQSNNYNGPVTYVQHGLKVDVDTLRIVEGEESDCIYFTSVQTVNIDYKLFPYSGTYYTCDVDVIEAEAEIALTSIENNLWHPTNTTYVVSTEYFDLIPFAWRVTDDKEVFFNEHIVGTKIDLNSGTIFSKNFILDNNGDVSIRGSLVNNQFSVLGSKQRKNPGVYVGPDGIGLGNGAFAVDNLGNLNTIGDVTMWGMVTDSDGNPYLDEMLKIDSATGSITLKGSISWDAVNGPVCVLYHSGATKDDRGNIIFVTPSNPGLDEREYSQYQDNATHGWHKVFQKDGQESPSKLYPDYYASYSYDGGKTWTDAVKIKGEDGEAIVDYDSIKDVLADTYKITHTEIDEYGVTTPIIEAAQIYGGNIYGCNFTALSTTNGDGSRMDITNDGIICYNADGDKHGLVAMVNTNYVYEDGLSLYSYDHRIFSVTRTANDVNVMFYGANKHTGNLNNPLDMSFKEYGRFNISASSNNIRVNGTWDFVGDVTFSGTVTGLKVAFG